MSPNGLRAGLELPVGNCWLPSEENGGRATAKGGCLGCFRRGNMYNKMIPKLPRVGTTDTHMFEGDRAVKGSGHFEAPALRLITANRDKWRRRWRDIGGEKRRDRPLGECCWCCMHT